MDLSPKLIPTSSVLALHSLNAMGYVEDDPLRSCKGSSSTSWRQAMRNNKQSKEAVVLAG